ncbi:MAG: biotin--[acetyl-CoA-carboxylase] ligase [Methanobrevibacter sp.]|jgi:BirA family biotin operon repressor/biotin-[acetyl-CoA-carboxylase] ligase|uniref:biotin--[acetyl-CoA-carboxylase] ligase n=1 Tax=Methanobrevibacter sp. TaxID=66852 RepID=UPI0025F85D66|nr:biotin--[acetyl-CoA-carboxylase] ligase [Methanobrevibacter sp.]MBE6498441.1 biotin--[acetyl-CoA-carboxylase] ligase [Methanobrevibacter sp.]
MRNEIVNLLKKENKLSDNTIDELKNINIDDFSNIVKEIGKEETTYIKADEISKDLQTEYIGKDLYIFNEVSSTNTLAKFLSMNGAENGTVIISEKQTKAKGRSGKSWESPLGGVWLSIIINPIVDYSKLPLITLATGVAVAKTMERIGVENSEIKWPNDIMINGKKVCGILTEAVTKFNTIESVIIGVGIDANLNVTDFPEELQEGTTTLKEELKKEGNENLLIKIFLEEFEKINELFIAKEYEAILKEWRKRSYSIGKIVEVREPFNTYYDAYVLGISKEGALIVEKIDGTLEKVISGECIIKN